MTTSKVVIRYIVLFIFALSCGSNPKKQENNEGQGPTYGEVNLKMGEGPSTKELDIAEDSANPLNKIGGDKNPVLRSNGPIICLFFGPGLLNSLALVRAIKVIEQSQIKIHMVSGVGFGAVLAALYAKFGSSGKTEWEIFKILRSTFEKHPVMDIKWMKLFSKNLNKLFGATAIEDLDASLFLPLLSKANQSVIYQKKGKIGPILDHYLGLKSQSSNNPYIYPYFRDIINENSLKSRGADLVFFANVLPEKVELSDHRGFLFGVLNTYAEQVVIEGSRQEHFFSYKMKNEKLDTLNSFSDSLKQVEVESEHFKEKMKQAIQEWSEKGTSDLILDS